MPSMIRNTDSDKVMIALQYIDEFLAALDLTLAQIAPIRNAQAQLDILRALQASASIAEDSVRTLLVGNSRLRLFRPVPNTCERVVEFGVPINEGSREPSEGDIYKCPPDMPVIAPATMRVLICRGENAVYGRRVIGVVTGMERYSLLLAHLSRIDVDEGDEIEAGTQIGAAGDTGNANFVQVLFALADKQDTKPLPGLKAPDAIGGSWIASWPYTVRNPEDAHIRLAKNAEG